VTCPQSLSLPFVKCCFRVDRKQIAYLRFILESYDGLAFMRTLESRQALVEIAYPPSRSKDAQELISALRRETGMETARLPEGFEPPEI